MPFQLANTLYHFPLVQSPYIPVKDTFPQVILQHAQSFALQQDEEELGSQGLPQHDKICILHQRLFLKGFL